MAGKLMTPEEVDRMFERAIEKIEGLYAGKEKQPPATAASVQPSTPTALPSKEKVRRKKRLPLGNYGSLESQKMLLKLARIEHNKQKKKSDFTILPAVFDVPDEEPYPEAIRGETININGFRSLKPKDKIHPKIGKKLDDMKFVWDLDQHTWKMNIWALKLYKVLHHDDLDIDPSYRIPNKDTAFARDMWNYPLGAWLARIRANARTLPEDKKRLLADVGVQWSE
ncbi:Aste57867_13758 [Aphanomyces stellatus]|uniref:Aste57867_13758 protein n=1 Tax=Aphanomyces stellatus TaxID=120398 RepID=A0A485KZH9_9STRA|nr:hypothetical protein As57867_013708 [Aphanomyces stellatus]VFT90591.1 Aste57867_13758 [Aphanomyces stellatus]